ncbi:tripartite tricarboxylate transporter TctB family protein [Chryseomicrobium palamuruense]|uniref:Tripartite tricarboxylate transporter TctB family protein n=1 Tax=Chryseomicrobium palamuruense TaxID=682973 RepID=A0ABV8USJ1_9BACL
MVLKHTIATSLVLILCIVFFMQTINYPTTAARLPQILLVIIAALAIIMLMNAIRASKNENDKFSKEINIPDSEIQMNSSTNNKVQEIVNVKRVVIFGLLIAGYILLMEIIGYFIITPLFVFISLMYLRATTLIWAIILSIGFTAFIYGIFSMFLNVPVPLGILFGN